jgi:exopolysaccharide biosynthesis polyprenyl glycosylphosphotransferase
MTDMAWVGTSRDAASANARYRSVEAVVDETGPETGGEPSAVGRMPELGRRLRMLDAGAVIAAVVLAWTFDGDGVAIAARVVLGAVTVAATVLAIAANGLYRARACAVRSVELVGLARAAAIGALSAVVAGRLIGLTVVATSLAAAAVTFLALASARGGFVAWLRRARTQGRYSRSIVVVGAAVEAERLVWLLRQHPELGLRPVGVVGEDAEQGTIDGVPWLGGIDTVLNTLALVGANGVVIASSELDAGDLNATVRTLLAAGVHVQLSGGLWGIDHQRLRPVPLAHEPFVYVEPAGLRTGQRVCKRVLDVTASAALLVLAAPVLLVAMLAVRLQDGGPAIFRQIRIGKDGEPFTLFKLRTMVPDAEQQLVDVTSVNQRAGGPLFKATNDPRRTRVGRILETTSLDELPQLVNVLRGDMSLVGPRPALPHEVAEFDDELLGRHRVQPGITGLWQVEARDKPDFEIYRRLDLFYVENWSIGLDLAIMFSTVCGVLGRVVPHPEPELPEPELDLTESVA